MMLTWENEFGTVPRVNAERPLTRSLDLGEEGLAMQATRTCSVTDCDRPHEARGWCKPHWTRWSRHGDPLAGHRSPAPDGTCSIDGCQSPIKARGWCDLHWTHWHRNGDPLVTKPRTALLPGPANSKWLADDDVSYRTIHERLKRARGRAADYECAECPKPARQWAYDHADPDERIADYRGKRMPFSLKQEHYRPLCLRCHWRADHLPRHVAETRGVPLP